MMIAVTTIHVIACVILVLSVLLQAGKGADMGAVFGGASTTIFGSSGAGNFLTRITTGAAICFMLTSLALTYAPQRAGVSSVMPESAPVPGAVGEAPIGDTGADATGEAAPGDASMNQQAAPVEQAGGGEAPAADGAAAPAAPAPVPNAQPNAPAPAPNAAAPAPAPAGGDAPATAE